MTNLTHLCQKVIDCRIKSGNDFCFGEKGDLNREIKRLEEIENNSNTVFNKLWDDPLSGSMMRIMLPFAIIAIPAAISRRISPR